MKQNYRVIERDTFYTAQYKPWWFPYFWTDCYGFNTCCYAETAQAICDIHSEGKTFNEDEIQWVTRQLDHQHGGHFLNSKS